VPRHQYVLTSVSATLIFVLFAGIYMTGTTGHLGWLIGALILASATVLGYVLFAPERWRE